MGYIAQELAREFPEVVKEDFNGYYSIDYGVMTAPIIEAIKTLKDKIDSLETAIKSNNLT